MAHTEDHHHHHHHLSAAEHIAQGKAWLEAKDYDAAYHDLSVAVHLVEDHQDANELEDAELAELFLLRASALMSIQGEQTFAETETFHQVLDDLDQAVISQPQLPIYRLTRGRFYKRATFADFLEKAREDFESILDVFPTDMEALRELGEVMVRQEQFKEALPILTKAIELEPDAEAYVRRGLAYFKKTPPDFNAAAKDFYQAQLLDSQNEALYLWRAQAFQEMGDMKEALREYNLLLGFATDKPGYFVDRGFLKDSLGDEEGAFEDYNRALDMADHALAYNNRAMYFLRAGQYDEAISDAKAALATDPEAGIAYATLAEIYAALEDREELFTYLALALKKYYEDPVDLMLEPAFEPYLSDPEFLELLGRG